MSWYNKEQPTPLDNLPIEGLYFLDGDELARRLGVPWSKGQKCAQVVFPSGKEFAVWESSDPQALAIIHLFGEMDLPYSDERDRAFEQAFYIAEQCGYLVRKKGNNGLELVGHTPDENLVVIYDDTGHMADVVASKEQYEPPVQPGNVLMDDEIREKLPDLYSNEEIGLDAIAPVKYFTPDSNWTWYASEGSQVDENGHFDTDKEKVDFIFFGLVAGFEVEIGYFSLSELQEVRGSLGLPVERDLYYEPKTLKELLEHHKREY